MDNPSSYIMLQSIDDLNDYEGLDHFSNLGWGKEQARKMVDATGRPYIIYKLVPVFEVYVETTTRLVERDIE